MIGEARRHPLDQPDRPVGLPQQHRPGIRRHRTAVERRNHTAAIKPFEFELSRNTLRLHRTPHRTLATICRKRIISDSWGRCTPLDEISGLGRYEVHLDRKLERMLAMLLRLKELRRTTETK